MPVFVCVSNVNLCLTRFHHSKCVVGSFNPAWSMGQLKVSTLCLWGLTKKHKNIFNCLVSFYSYWLPCLITVSLSHSLTHHKIAHTAVSETCNFYFMQTCSAEFRRRFCFQTLSAQHLRKQREKQTSCLQPFYSRLIICSLSYSTSFFFLFPFQVSLLCVNIAKSPVGFVTAVIRISQLIKLFSDWAERLICLWNEAG